MAGGEFLAGERRRVVDRFIEDAAAVLTEGWSVAERNQLGVNLRFCVETQLVPGLLAVNALLPGASPEALQRDLPEWIEHTATALPVEAAFLTGVGREAAPLSYALLAENLGLSPDQCGRAGVPRPPPGHGALGGESAAFMTNRDPRPEGESVRGTERYRTADNWLNRPALTRSGCRVAGSRTTTTNFCRSCCLTRECYRNASR